MSLLPNLRLPWGRAPRSAGEKALTRADSSQNGGYLGSLLRWLFGHEGASGTLWNLALALIVTGGLTIAFAVINAWNEGGMLFSFLVSLLGSGVIVLGLSWKGAYEIDIPAEPPHIGVLTVWGERLPFIQGEGDAMTAPKIEYTLVSMVACDFDFEFEVQCRASKESAKDSGGGATENASIGSRVKVKISMTYFPDWSADDPDANPQRIIQYLNHNGREGVKLILQGMIGQGLRYEGGRRTAEEFILMQDALSVALLVDIADVEFREVPVDGNGNIPANLDIWDDDSPRRVSPRKYRENLMEIADPILYLFPEGGKGTDEQQARRKQSIKIFLKVAEQNGVSDVIDLGLRITRFNVEYMEPEEAIRQAAAKAEAELKERQGEMRDADTDIELAKKYVAESEGKMSFETALEIVRTNRGRAKELIVRSSGSPLLDAAAVIDSHKP